MNILMWGGIFIAALFGGIGNRRAVSGDKEGARKLYSMALGGAILAGGAFFYHYFETMAL